MKTVFLFSLIVIFTLSFYENLQSQTTISKKFNGLSSGYDMGNCAIVTSNNDILVAGCTDYGTNDMNGVLIKMDSSLNVIWSKRYLTSSTTIFSKIIQSYENGYLLVGQYTSNLMNPFGMYVVNIDSNGNVIWSKTYEGLGVSDVCTTSDHGYVLAGQTTSTGNSTICITKIDSVGNLQWSRLYRGTPGTAGESAASIKRTLDNNYIITGATFSFGVQVDAIFILKIDSMGNEVWNKTFDSNGPDSGSEIVLTNDSGFIVLGEGSSQWFGWGTLLMKVDKNGNLEWHKEYAVFFGAASGSGHSIINTIDSGFLIYTFFNGYSGLLYKVDSLFHLEWSKEFTTVWGGGGSLMNYNDGYIMAVPANYNNGDILVYKSDLSASDSCTVSLQPSEDSSCVLIVEDISFFVDTLGTSSDVITTTANFQFSDSIVCSYPQIVNETRDLVNEQFKIYPNPSEGIFKYKSNGNIDEMLIYNLFGELIYDQMNLLREVTINIAGQPPGIYLCKIISQGHSQVVKLVLN